MLGLNAIVKKKSIWKAETCLCPLLLATVRLIFCQPAC